MRDNLSTVLGLLAGSAIAYGMYKLHAAKQHKESYDRSVDSLAEEVGEDNWAVMQLRDAQQ